MNSCDFGKKKKTTKHKLVKLSLQKMHVQYYSRIRLRLCDSTQAPKLKLDRNRGTTNTEKPFLNQALCALLLN